MIRAVRVLPLLLLMQVVLVAQGFGGWAVFDNTFTDITLAAVSNPIRNVGQSMHLIRIAFPAAAGAVSPIQVRLEFTNDGTTWLPMSADVISVPNLGGLGQTYTFQRAYGVFRAIRVRSVVNVPGGVGGMTVQYAGHLLPIIPFLSQLGDRFSF